MPNVITEIKHWAKSLPYWEQATLDKILSGNLLANTDYDELVDYLLSDSGLSSVIKPHLKLIHLATADPSVENTSTSIILNRIFNLQNINALIPGQELSFCPNLTAIYGETGAGKSGYARVLGCAGFTRGDKLVLPDIAKPWDSDIIRSANIEILENNSPKVIKYIVGESCNELSQCYVFDSTSVHMHLTGTNSFSFSPSGLTILTQLSDETDKVRQLLQNKIEDYRKPHNFMLLFQGKTEVTDFIQTIGLKTNLEELFKLSTFSTTEANRTSQLDIEIAALKTLDIPKQLTKLRQTITDLDKLVKQLGEIDSNLNDKSIESVNNSITQYAARELLLTDTSLDQFKSKYFKQIGSETWQKFIILAKALADLESQPNSNYPQVNDRCLLCQQTLDPEAVKLLKKIWKYLESDAQLKRDLSQQNLSKKRSILNSIDLDFFDDQMVSFRHLKEHDVELQSLVISYLEQCRNRRELALKMIDSKKVVKVSPLVLLDIINTRINAIIEKLKLESSQLEQQNTLNKINELSQELLTLQHRKILSNNISKIKDYINDLKWADKASKIGGSTSHITKKYKELFDSLVTKEYLKLFEEFLQNLRRYIKVKVVTRGQKGKTIKHIALETDPTVDAEIATPERVLSEGEKRAVALADFLTEVALDITSSTIILDDPVTSLDLEWKEAVASTLFMKQIGDR